MQNLPGPPQDVVSAVAQDLNNLVSLFHHLLTQSGPVVREVDKDSSLNILQLFVQKIFKRLFEARGGLLLEDTLITVLKILRHHDRADPPQVVPEFTRLLILWLSAPALPTNMPYDERRFSLYGDLILR